MQAARVGWCSGVQLLTARWIRAFRVRGVKEGETRWKTRDRHRAMMKPASRRRSCLPTYRTAQTSTARPS